jgi:hypothetical protein
MMDGMARLFEPDLPLVWPMPTPAQSPQQMRGGSWMG